MKRSQTDKKAQNGELAVGHGVKAGNKIQENQIETLTVEEELQIIRWGCSKIVDMGQVMEPPIPMEIRVCYIAFSSNLHQILTMSVGHSYPVPSPFLSFELSNDISSQADHDVCFVPCH